MNLLQIFSVMDCVFDRHLVWLHFYFSSHAKATATVDRTVSKQNDDHAIYSFAVFVWLSAGSDCDWHSWIGIDFCRSFWKISFEISMISMLCPEFLPEKFDEINIENIIAFVKNETEFETNGNCDLTCEENNAVNSKHPQDEICSFHQN